MALVMLCVAVAVPPPHTRTHPTIPIDTMGSAALSLLYPAAPIPTRRVG